MNLKSTDYQKLFAENPRGRKEAKTTWLNRIAAENGLKPGTVQRMWYTYKNDNPEEVVKRDMREAKTKAELAEVKKKYKSLMKTHERLEDRFNHLSAVKSDNSFLEVDVAGKANKHRGVAIVGWSDWHVGETVDPSTNTMGNEYTPDIAEHRIKLCTQNSVKLIHMAKKELSVDHVFLWIGGDMITGYIHEELMELNGMSPIEEIHFVKKRLIGAIKYLKEHAKVKKITVVCQYGNHGRTNVKKKIATGHKNSFEWGMYLNIADYFDEDKVVSVSVPNSLMTYTKFDDFNIRSWHGCNIRYGGGVGGVTVPLHKHIHRQDQNTPADHNILGHYHTYQSLCGGRAHMNGSLIGYGPYAESIGAPIQRPLQMFQILDLTKNMITGRYPIFCS